MNGHRENGASSHNHSTVYCTYCGRSFTRKEHLERHLPHHTNVKPHRCACCQLSFTRRDLLQRHYSTYHEPSDSIDQPTGGASMNPGQTPIACQNCASAKTGCDKRVPCSRCSEKGLSCAPRYARRSSNKTAARASKGRVSTKSISLSSHQMQQLPLPQTVNPTLMQVGGGALKLDLDASVSPNEGIDRASAAIDLHLQNGSPGHDSPGHFHINGAELPLSAPRVTGLESFMPVVNDLVSHDPTFSHMAYFSDYNLDFDMYGFPRTDMLSALPEFSDMSSGSHPLASTSSRGSTLTQRTGTLSAVEFDSRMKLETSNTSAATSAGKPDFEVVLQAEAAWPLARCNPCIYPRSCPKTAITHLECLELKSKQEGTWNSLERYLKQVDWESSTLASVVPLTSRTRDQMLAITQSFLHKALEVHRGGTNGHVRAGHPSPGDCSFIVLPPSRILEYFLRSYVRSLSVYYPLVAGGCVDPNEMLQNNHSSTLLVLLMIAQGAAAMPIAEARHLAAGLTETCRISLFDMIERDVELSADPVALRCALLFTVLGAWSGDKWLMDIAMAQRGMYMTMLEHAGMLQPRTPMVNDSTNVEFNFATWRSRESQNRLVYNWVMLDQELSLFYDTAPIFDITQLRCPLPDLELYWMASTSAQWYGAVQSICGTGPSVVPPLASSLLDLFQDFLHSDVLKPHNRLSPQQLRLLLHPLQSILYHLSRMLLCFSDTISLPAHDTRDQTQDATVVHLKEVQGLLQKWYNLMMNFHDAKPDCPVTRCNTIMYHLISLNAITNFPELERLARREGFSTEGGFWDAAFLFRRYILHIEEAVMHCGQVFKLVRRMPIDSRPNWWAAAVYRVTLILWAISISSRGNGYRDEDATNGSCPSSPRQIVIDQATPQDPAVTAYVWQRNGIAVLMKPDGSLMGLESASKVLQYGVKALGDLGSSRIVDGIRRKLTALGEAWEATSFPDAIA